MTYDGATDEWTDLPAKCERRTSAYAAVDPTTDSLVVVGGWRVRGDLLDPDPAINNGHFDEEVGTMQMLANPTDTAWTNLPPMISAVSNFVGGVIGTKHTSRVACAGSRAGASRATITHGGMCSSMPTYTQALRSLEVTGNSTTRANCVATFFC